MKKIFLSALVAFSALFFCGFLKIGAPAPEFAKGEWLKGNSFALASVKGKKMTAILFWKPDHASALAIQNFSRTAHDKGFADVAFAAVAEGELKNIASFPLIRQFGNLPLLVDTSKKNIPLFLRSENRLPMAIIIGKDGKLLWRGNPTRTAFMLDAIKKGKYDQKKVIGDDDFNANFTGMIVKSNFKGALALLEKELDRPGTNPSEIVSLQVGIHYRRLNSAENALAAIHKAQKKFPGRPEFYEMELKMLDWGHMEKKTGEFYYRLTSIFKNQPKVLLKFVVFELNKPFEKMNPASVYTVARAAANAGTYANKREKGRAMLYYAQSLYCIGRVDVAHKVVEKSLTYLKGEKEYAQAKNLAAYYKKLLDFAPSVKE